MKKASAREREMRLLCGPRQRASEGRLRVKGGDARVKGLEEAGDPEGDPPRLCDERGDGHCEHS